MVPSGRSAINRPAGTQSWLPGHGPVTPRSSPRAPPPRGSPAFRRAPYPSRRVWPPRPNWSRGGWAWPTTPRSCGRSTQPGGPRRGARPSGPWPHLSTARPAVARWSWRWWCSPRADPALASQDQPPVRRTQQPVRKVARAPRQPRGPVGGPLPPGGLTEVGGQIAGPPPRLDRRGAVEQVEVRGHRVRVGRAAERVAGPVREQPGDAGVPRHAQSGRLRLELAGLRQRLLAVAGQQRQAPGEQLVLEPEPPPEDQVAPQQRRRLG